MERVLARCADQEKGNMLEVEPGGGTGRSYVFFVEPGGGRRKSTRGRKVQKTSKKGKKKEINNKQDQMKHCMRKKIVTVVKGKPY